MDPELRRPLTEEERNTSFGEAVGLLVGNVAFLIVALVAWILGSVAWTLLQSLLGWTGDQLNREWKAILFLGVIIVVGSLLFALKVRKRFLYGAMEIVFALCAGWKWFFIYRASQSIDAIALVGIIYLVVRGLDNCNEAIKIQRKGSPN